MASVAVLLGVVATASAQEDIAPVPIVQLEKVEVTGSNIRRTDGESGLPIQVFTREDILNAGIQTAQELLERISANQSFGGWNEAMGEGNVITGFTAASLRGLGYQRTLVLLDGRRLAPYALSGGQSVDLSAIPASAIEKVEILKDGASAVYGTDAIGGVINFILRKDFHGLELNANDFITDHSGANNGRVNATAGSGDLARDRYNLFVSADYFKQQALRATQRDTTKTAYLPALGLDQTVVTSYPANIRQPGGFGNLGGFPANPTIPFPGGATPDSCAPPYSFPIPLSPFTCRFDYASVIETVPEAEKASVVGRFTVQVNARNQLFAEGSYYRGTFTQRISPAPVSNGTATLGSAFTLPPTSPYYPGAFVASLPNGNPDLPVFLNYRTIELGPRTDEVTVDQWRGILGLKGSIRGWDYEMSASYTANKQIDRLVSGYLGETAFAALVESGVVNPFGPNTDAVLAQMRATQITGQANDNRASNYGGDMKLSGSVYDMPAGPLAIAVGLEGRRESLSQANSDFFATGDILGGAGAVPSLPETHRRVWSAYAEMNVPFTRTFAVDVAARYDHYSDFGGTTNPKITLRWQPARQIVVRASAGTGFRAPTLSDLFQPTVVAQEADGPFDDPVRCPVTRSESDCHTAIGAQFGGNPRLQPETSRQVNAGVVIEPSPGLSASIDYYRVRIDNLIQQLTGSAIFADFARWSPGYVVRKPSEPPYPDLPGEIAYVVEIPINAGTLATSGIDIDLRWRPASSALGRFTFSVTGTYFIDYGISDLDTALFPSHVGTRGPTGAISRWRHYASLDWTGGQWGATLAQVFQDGYSEPDLLTCDSAGNVCTRTRRVGSYSVWDLQGRYTGFRNITLSLGVRNVLDTPPPVSNQFNTFQVGVDPTYADPRGRMYYAAIRYAFR